MPAIKARDLQRRIAAEGRPIRSTDDVKATSTFNQLSEALALADDGRPLLGKLPQVKLEDFSIREMFASLVRNKADGQPVGDSFVQEYFRDENGQARMIESGAIGAVDYSMFMGITGQLLVNAVLSRFTSEDFVFTQIAGKYPTNLVDGERIPGVALPADPDPSGEEDVTLVPEGQSYKSIGFGQEYVDLPATATRGLIIPVTRLAVYADRTGLIARQAGEVGYVLGLRKEKRGIGTLLGLGPQFTEFRQFDSTPVTIDLYQQAGAVSGSGQLSYAYPTRKFPFVNDVPANPLTDYTSFRTAEQYFSKTVDPSTGEPIVVGRPMVFAPHTRAFDLPQILEAVNIWKLSQQGINSVGAILTNSPNPVKSAVGMVDFKLSRQLRAQMVQQLYGGTDNGSADKLWFYGDFNDAIKYQENWPITVTQAPANSEAEFMQDVVVRFKASERSTWSVWNPRVLQRNNFQSMT